MSAWLALAAPPSAPQLNGQEKYFKSSDDMRGRGLKLAAK
jgi:hypothetical protein